MKKYLLTGLIFLLPIAITFWIFHFIFDLLTTPFIGLIQDALNAMGMFAPMHPWLLFLCRLIVLFLVIGLIILLGFVAQRIFFNWFVNLTQKIFLKIPIIKTVYKMSHEVIKSLFSPGVKPFKKTVLMDFPNGDSKALGFYTSDIPKTMVDLDERDETHLQSVFLPTAPHPISGFLLITSRSKLKDVDISTEDVFKILVSCGTYQPEPSPKTDGNQDTK